MNTKIPSTENLRDYRCKCHVCGREYIRQAYFMSSNISLIAEDGSTVVGAACSGHTKDEIRTAWFQWLNANSSKRVA